VDSKDYAAAARHYDPAYEAKEDLGADVVFYRDLAVANRGPVLEVACGTGRVLLEIADVGIEIDGLDYCDPFLDILRAKLAQRPPETQSNVILHRGDMRDFSLGKKFPLIIIPFRPLQHLYTIEDQIATFMQLRTHLTDRGQLAFNVFAPRYDLLEQIGHEQVDTEYPDPDDPELIVRRYFVRHSLNRLQQYFDGEFIYRTFRGDKIVLEERAPLRMSYYSYPHLQLLFEHCGFEVEAEYGSFEKEPIEVFKEMIFVLRKKQGGRGSDTRLRL